MSETRKRYFIRLYARIIIFILCLIMCFKPGFYNILNGMNFFLKFHPLHLLWLIWLLDMIQQIIPIKSKLALGSQKLFLKKLQLIKDKITEVDGVDLYFLSEKNE